MYPHITSNPPEHIFSGIIKTETTHYSRLSSTFDDYNFVHNLFTLRLTALDYPDTNPHTLFPLSFSHQSQRENEKQETGQTKHFYHLLQNKIQQTHTNWQNCPQHTTKIPQHAHPKNWQKLTATLRNSTQCYWLTKHHTKLTHATTTEESLPETNIYNSSLELTLCEVVFNTSIFVQITKAKLIFTSIQILTLFNLTAHWVTNIRYTYHLSIFCVKFFIFQPCFQAQGKIEICITLALFQCI